MASLHLYAFGKLRMQYGDEVVASFPTHHVEELLSYCLLNQHVHQPREKLIEILWPHSTPANARARFSTVLWRLRSVFDQIGVSPDDYLQISRDWICFEPRHPICLDLATFERHVDRAKVGAGDTVHEETLRMAVAVYRGDFCEGVYTDWCLIERERLARLYLWAMGQLMACLIQRQVYDEAINLGLQLLQYDPLREEVHRAIMYCFWQMGQRAEAVRQFQRCAQLLMDELRIVPMPETVSLYGQIVADRMIQAQSAIEPSGSFAIRLQAAFSEFHRAGEKLNRLLDQAGT